MKNKQLEVEINDPWMGWLIPEDQQEEKIAEFTIILEKYLNKQIPLHKELPENYRGPDLNLLTEIIAEFLLPYQDNIKILIKNGEVLPSITLWQLSNIMASRLVDDCLQSAAKNGDDNGDSNGQRVKVWNGDQSEYLGEGYYTGDVNAYFLRMPDGSLGSNSDAEKPPVDIPAGAEVVGPMMNPKIVLDSGRTVYGCQTWWEPV